MGTAYCIYTDFQQDRLESRAEKYEHTVWQGRSVNAVTFVDSTGAYS